MKMRRHISTYLPQLPIFCRCLARSLPMPSGVNTRPSSRCRLFTARGISRCSGRYPDRPFFGLTLVAVGSGGIKPCVASNVGDQFGKTNKHLLSRAYSWYWPTLGRQLPPCLRPGCWNTLGRQLWRARRFHGAGDADLLGRPPGICPYSASRPGVSAGHHRPRRPAGGEASIGDLCLVAAFWSLFDQQGSTWVLQAQNMDRMVFGVELLPHRFWLQIRFDHLAYTDLYLPDLSGHEQTVQVTPAGRCVLVCF